MKNFLRTFSVKKMTVSGIAIGIGFPILGCGSEHAPQGIETPSNSIQTEIKLLQNTDTQFEALRYANVKPIIDARCVVCHRPGGNAAFLPLTTLAQIRPVRGSMYNSIVAKRMPQGDPGFGETSNGRLLLNCLRTGADLR